MRVGDAMRVDRKRNLRDVQWGGRGTGWCSGMDTGPAGFSVVGAERDKPVQWGDTGPAGERWEQDQPVQCV